MNYTTITSPQATKQYNTISTGPVLNTTNFTAITSTQVTKQYNISNITILPKQLTIQQ